MWLAEIEPQHVNRALVRLQNDLADGHRSEISDPDDVTLTPNGLCPVSHSPFLRIIQIFVRVGFGNVAAVYERTADDFVPGRCAFAGAIGRPAESLAVPRSQVVVTVGGFDSDAERLVVKRRLVRKRFE